VFAQSPKCIFHVRTVARRVHNKLFHIYEGVSEVKQTGVTVSAPSWHITESRQNVGEVKGVSLVSLVSVLVGLSRWAWASMQVRQARALQVGGHELTQVSPEIHIFITINTLSTSALLSYSLSTIRHHIPMARPLQHPFNNSIKGQ
jgi:hypothetical protein